MLKSGPLAPYNHVQRLIKGRQYLQMARGLMVGLSNETLSIRFSHFFLDFFSKILGYMHACACVSRALEATTPHNLFVFPAH